MKRWWDDTRVVLAVVWVASALYLSPGLERGWIPHDEGVIAHSAERVLQGDLPHRDFDEVYTGGLTYLHAVGFELFGTRLTSLRLVLLAFALAFVPALYGIALRFVPPIVAGVVTVVGVTWSLPNYFASMPSWYNLFFATFGTLALLRHLESGGRGWLALAGACGGLSILVKIAGVYFVAAALLFLVYREQCLSRGAGRDADRPTGVLWPWKALMALLFVGALVRMVGSRLGTMEVVHFVLPGAVLCAFLVWSERREGRGAPAARVRSLLQLVGPFALGVAAPLAVFLIPFLLSGALDDLFRGLFVLPTRRLDSAAMALPAPATLLAALPYAALLIAAPALSRVTERTLAVVLALALAAVVATAGTQQEVYQVVWYGLRPLAPIAAVVGCLLLARPFPAAPIAPEKRQALFLLIAVASLASLVQFPYSFGVYFYYAAPLVALAIVAIVSLRPAPRLLHLCVLGFYLAFALLWLNTAFVRGVGLRYIANGQTSRLNLERAPLLVYEDRKQEYERLIALVQQHADTPFIYAAPDTPEIYFLSARRNPTRGMFDIFDEPEGRTSRILEALDAKHVKVAVIHERPEFSPPLAPDLAAGLRARFPHREQVGRFQVGWRD